MMLRRIDVGIGTKAALIAASLCPVDGSAGHLGVAMFPRPMSRPFLAAMVAASSNCPLRPAGGSGAPSPPFAAPGQAWWGAGQTVFSGNQGNKKGLDRWRALRDALHSWFGCVAPSLSAEPFLRAIGLSCRVTAGNSWVPCRFYPAQKRP